MAGALDISFSSFSPAGGDSFNILDFTGHTGTFTSVTLPPLSGGLTWDTSQLYTTGIISVVGPHVVGDYNGNGIVDAADYTVWRDSLGSTGSLAADGDASGVIDVGDYGVWKANFGSHAGIGAGAPMPPCPSRPLYGCSSPESWRCALTDSQSSVNSSTGETRQQSTQL